MRFVPAIDPPHVPCPGAYWCLFHGDRLLVALAGDVPSIPRISAPSDLGLTAVRTQYLGTLDSVPCFSGEVVEAADPPGTEWRPLRPLLGAFDDETFALAGRAFQVMDWARTSRYCGRCGTATVPVPGERATACESCGIHFFPRISPAVIVAIVRDDRLLLATAKRFPNAFHSVLAGFVEPGETLEGCIAREVREEVGIEVTDIRYFGSQPWPFPGQLMIGFTARHAGGEIVPEEKEIVSAGWFTREEAATMNLPRPQSISRQLIGWFLDGAAPR
jgi:NAD+ diphosphatase